MASPGHTFEDIDDLGEMIKVLEALDLTTKGHASIETMKNAVREFLRKNSAKETSLQADKPFKDISDASKEDARKCREMIKMYTKMTVCLDMLDDTLMHLIQENLGDVRAKIKYHKERLKIDEHFILVAGETGAGKSRMINLILGEEVLPYAVLSTTSTIFELKYAAQCSMTIHFKNKDPFTGLTTKCFKLKEEKGRKSVLDQISKYVNKSNDRKKENPYQKVELFWPHPLLQDGVVIVDSPGIGESDIMDSQVIQYLPEAMAFIYVINSSNAGGVQEDRIEKLLRSVRKMSEKEQAGFSPRNALFVCNKWDTIPQEEAEGVESDTAEKLKDNWPGIDTDTQIVYLSTTKAIRLQTLRIVNEDLANLLTSIKRLVLNSMQARLEVSWKWLHMLLSRVIFCTKALLNNSIRNREEKQSRVKAIIQRYTQLQENQQAVMEDLRKLMNKNVSEAVVQLKNYLTSDSFKREFCHWTPEEVPPVESSCETTMCSVRMYIHRRLQKKIKTWEQEEEVLSKRRELLRSNYIRKYDNFEEQLQSLESDIVQPRSGNDRQIKTSDQYYVDDMPVKTKVMIGVTSPIWVPVGIVALAIGVPVFGVMAIKEKVEEKKNLNKYENDPCKFMGKKSRRFLDEVSNGDELTQFVQAQFADADVCLKQMEACIPKLIEADKQLCKKLQDEARTQIEVIQLYSPKLEKCKDLQGDLGMLAIREIRPLKFSIKNVEWKEERKHLLGRGAFAAVYRGKFHQEKESKVVDIAVKAYNEVLTKHNVVQFFDEEDALRNLQHPNIVQYYGSVFRATSDKQVQPCIVMELCETSLKSHIFDNPEQNVPSRSLRATSKTIDWLVEIACALKHIHRKGYVHRDLKLENILVSTSEQIKVSDVGFTKKEQDITGTVCGTPVYMAPEVYDGKKYSSKADIYSLGIIMWEMWYGHQAFQEVMDRTEVQFFERVRSGYRPGQVSGQNPPPRKLQSLMQCCWQTGPDNRPTADMCLDMIMKSRQKFAK